MADIVDRLRVKWQHRGDSAAKKISQLIRESVEAADEIERLRKLLLDTESQRDEWEAIALDLKASTSANQ